MAYRPQVGRDYKTGLQLNREPFIIADDAYVVLLNAYTWRGRVRKKLGASLVGRLRRDLTGVSYGNSAASPWTFNLFTDAIPPIGSASVEANKSLTPANPVFPLAAVGPVISITFNGITFIDNGDGTMRSATPGNSGTINYATGDVTLIHTGGAGHATTANVSYFPDIPVMGLPSKTLLVINEQELIAFDQRYAYIYNNSTARFLEAPSTLTTTWNGSNSQQFWAENAYTALFVTNDVQGLQGYTPNRFQNAAAGPPSTVDVRTTAANNLQLGDEVIFINLDGPAAANNGLRGIVTVIIAPDEVTIKNVDGTPTFPITWTNGAPSTGVMIVANQNLHGDGIRWYDDATWMNFNPVVNRISAVMGCGIIIFYRGRIVLLDTLEGNSLTPSSTRFPQRARWSQNGTPFDIGPLPAGSNAGIDYQAWREDVVGKGGFIDCPTTEEIVSACFLRDTLIVGFENSTWKLRYTNNELLPFIWERLDVELGHEGRFSGVKFDKFTLGVGIRGIIACDGVGVTRIDQLIPDIVFNFRNTQSGPERIASIRDFELQIVYWTFPNNQEGIFPNQVLVYNYLDNSFGVFDDTFTCYGYWQSFFDLTWEDATDFWEDYELTWVGQTEDALNPNVVAGNQQGFVMRPQDPERVSNDPTLQVSNVTFGTPATITSPNHNLQSGQILQAFGFIQGHAFLNGQVFQAQVVDANNFELYQYNALTGTYDKFTIPSPLVYFGLGTFARVDNFRMLSKKFNPFLDDAVSVRMKQIDFYVNGTSAGRFAVNLFVNDQNNTPVNAPSPIQPVTPTSNPLSNRVETFANPYEIQGQDKYWHSLFDTVTGNLFQLEITYGDQELNDPAIFGSDVEIHSIAPQYEPASKRLT